MGIFLTNQFIENMPCLKCEISSDPKIPLIGSQKLKRGVIQEVCILWPRMVPYILMASREIIFFSKPSCEWIRWDVSRLRRWRLLPLSHFSLSLSLHTSIFTCFTTPARIIYTAWTMDILLLETPCPSVRPSRFLQAGTTARTFPAGAAKF